MSLIWQALLLHPSEELLNGAAQSLLARFDVGMALVQASHRFQWRLNRQDINAAMRQPEAPTAERHQCDRGASFGGMGGREEPGQSCPDDDEMGHPCPSGAVLVHSRSR